MKTLTLMLTTSFMLLFAAANAQVKTNPEHTTPQPSGVTKGYYAIGNKAEKLSRPSSWGVTTSESYPNIHKGYYAIGNNNRKLGKQLVVAGTGKRTAPIAPKGYYSIDRNNEKLKR